MKVETVLNYLLIGLIVVVLGSLFNLFNALTRVWEGLQNSVPTANNYYQPDNNIGFYAFLFFCLCTCLFGLSKLPYHNWLGKIKRTGRNTPPNTRPVTPPNTRPVTPPNTRPVTPPNTRPVTPPNTRPVPGIRTNNSTNSPYTPSMASVVRDLAGDGYEDDYEND